MAKNAISDIYVELGTQDISARVESVKLSLGRSAVDVTALGDAWADNVTGGVSRWAVTLGLYQDYASSDAGVYLLVKNMVTTQPSGTTFVCRPTSAAAGRTNPQIAGGRHARWRLRFPDGRSEHGEQVQRDPEGHRHPGLHRHEQLGVGTWRKQQSGTSTWNWGRAA